MAEMEQEARAALDDFMAQRLVFFIPGDPSATPAYVSSGTLFATRAGHVVVLTARHCATDATREAIRVGYHRSPQAIQNAVAGVTYHPDAEVDIALMAMNRQARRVLAAFALTPDAIADDDIDPATDALFIAGFPSAYVVRGNVREYGLVSITYGTGLADPPRDAGARYRVEWTEREASAGNVQIPHPEGISGGALWRFRGDPERLWSPNSRMRVAGVPVAWLASDRVELAEPSSKWRTWLIDACATIDRDVPVD